MTSGGIVSKNSTALACPYCHRGFLSYKKPSMAYCCTNCAKRLSCMKCNSERLIIAIEDDQKFVSCRTCGAKYWDDKFDRRIVKSESCSYCGNSDENCPYCKLKLCPRCTSRRIIQKKSKSNTKVFSCMTCNLEFSEENKSATLIVDPAIINKLAKNYFNSCPKCQSKNTVPVVDGFRCNKCGTNWKPHEVLDEDLSLNSNGLLDSFWKKACPKCNQTGHTIRLGSINDEKLQCLMCNHQWTNFPVECYVNVLCPNCLKSNHSIKPSKQSKSYHCLSCLHKWSLVNNSPQSLIVSTKFVDVPKKTPELCNKCKGGFIDANGICMRCHAKSTVILEDVGKDVISVSCPRCHAKESISSKTDLWCRCGSCEDFFSIPSAANKGCVSTFAKPSKSSLSEKNEEIYHRFKSHLSDFDELIQELMSAVAAVRDNLTSGYDTSDELETVESKLQTLAELHSYVAFGDDSVSLVDSNGFEDDESSEDHSIWDNGRDDRWQDHDRYAQTALGRYSEIQISDAGDDIFECATDEEEDDDKSIEYCHYCREQFNNHGVCPTCGCDDFID